MGYVFAVSAALLWGLAAIPVKLARAPGRLGIMVSMLVATVLLGGVLVVTGQMHIPEALPCDWVLILLVGILRFGVGVGFYFAAVQHAGVTTAAPILSLASIFVVLGGALFGMIELTWLLLVAAGLASVGGLVLGVGLKSDKTITNRRQLRRGVAYALVACVLISVGHLMIANVDDSLPKGLVTWFALLLGSVGYFAVLCVSGQVGRLKSISLREVVVYGCHGLLSFAGAYWLFLEALSILKVGRTQVIICSWPAVAAFIGVVVFREGMNKVKLTGIALMIGGAVLAVLAREVT